MLLINLKYSISLHFQVTFWIVVIQKKKKKSLGPLKIWERQKKRNDNLIAYISDIHKCLNKVNQNKKM